MDISAAGCNTNKQARARVLLLAGVRLVPPRRGVPRPGAPAQRRNHGTFKLYRVDEQERPDLVERFGVGTMPTLVVVEDKIVRARLERPRGCREIESFLAPWLK